MIYKTLVLAGLFAGSATADNMSLARTNLRTTEVTTNGVEHLEIELEVEGERQLFPLLPGTKCPTGHTCKSRGIKPFVEVTMVSTGTSPLTKSIRDNSKTPLTAAFNWHELNNELNTVVNENKYCSRRKAMARAAGIAAGVAAATVSQPAFAAETKQVLMGTDAGGLKFVPEKTSICKGDSVKWVINKAGPHNVVFDEDAIPSGVSQEKISMEDQLAEEGESFVMKFDTAGDYAFYCEPHRGAGMNGNLIVV